jgi:hypothetical protein
MAPGAQFSVPLIDITSTARCGDVCMCDCDSHTALYACWRPQPAMVKALTNGGGEISLEYSKNCRTKEVVEFVGQFLTIAGFVQSKQSIAAAAAACA